MNNTIVELPFEVERACRCSFVVKFADGSHAFITNENLFTLMMNPETPFKTVEKVDKRGIVQKWVIVAKCTWTLGFKTRLYGPYGSILR